MHVSSVRLSFNNNRLMCGITVFSIIFALNLYNVIDLIRQSVDNFTHCNVEELGAYRHSNKLGAYKLP